MDNENEVENDLDMEYDIPANYEVDEDGGDRDEFDRGYRHAFTIGFADHELAREFKDDMVIDSSLAQGLYEGFRDFFRQRAKENERMDELEEQRARNVGRTLER
ncbi:MAG: hypothetical protein GC178_18220 [Flavobacteriales bacterium]|nr:hypothetical protein [Flavobacteriales bacterium]